jgi:hypothetical protein
MRNYGAQKMPRLQRCKHGDWQSEAQLARPKASVWMRFSKLCVACKSNSFVLLSSRLSDSVGGLSRLVFGSVLTESCNLYSFLRFVREAVRNVISEELTLPAEEYRRFALSLGNVFAEG